MGKGSESTILREYKTVTLGQIKSITAAKKQEGKATRNRKKWREKERLLRKNAEGSLNFRVWTRINRAEIQHKTLEKELSLNALNLSMKHTHTERENRQAENKVTKIRKEISGITLSTTHWIQNDSYQKWESKVSCSTVKGSEITILE